MTKRFRFDAFISYCRVDADWADRLKAALESHNLTVWIDRDQMRPGNILVEDTDAALNDCRSFLLIRQDGVCCLVSRGNLIADTDGGLDNRKGMRRVGRLFLVGCVGSPVAGATVHPRPRWDACPGSLLDYGIPRIK